MPDTISLSASVSLGLLAGIVSGVCYLMANGITWTRSEEEDGKACVRGLQDARGECGERGLRGLRGARELRELRELRGGNRRCGGERGLSCACEHQYYRKFESGGWFLRQLQQAVYHMPWGLSTDRLQQIDEECEAGDGGSEERSGGDLRNVRDFLEALATRLAGGDLAATSVAPMYTHHAWR